jgi:hypothetical protein
MLELLEWGKKGDEQTAGPGADPNPPAAALSGAGGAATAVLAELSTRLEAVEGAEPKARIATLARIQDSGASHVSALLAQYLVNAAGTPAAREAAWTSLVNYQSRLAQALCALAGAQLTLLGAARALQALRTLAKLHAVHYAGVPGKLWRVAYAIHAGAENAGFSTTPVHAQSGHQTTVELELLRVLMLRVSAPDMMAPEQIEVADRVVEQLGGEFALRQPGVADNPFCFEPESEFPPRRANGRPPSGSARCFGPGAGYGSLQRIAKQLGAGKLEDFKAFGKDIAPGVQLGTVQHLLTFWRVDCPYAPPAHAPASGTLQVVHGYDPVWQYLSEARGGVRELSLADSSAAAPQPPETWELRGAGGSELGAEVPPASRVWAKCGALIGLAMRDGERWVGMIRRMHARPDGGLQADLAVLSREPRAQSLHEMPEMGEERAVSDAASRAFAFAGVNAVIVADGADGAQPANLLLPAQRWKEGRIYELQAKDAPRYLRALQAVRRGDDYVRATFEWVSPPA